MRDSAGISPDFALGPLEGNRRPIRPLCRPDEPIVPVRGTGLHSPPMAPPSRRAALAILALFGLLWFRRRPVRHPEPRGDWHPTEP